MTEAKDFYAPSDQDPDTRADVPTLSPARMERFVERLVEAYPELAPDGYEPETDAEINSKHAAVWHEAISVIDATETHIRDMIERLPVLGSDAEILAALGRVLDSIFELRAVAFMDAFKFLRDHEIVGAIDNATVAKQAAQFLREDMQRIENAIRTGLTRGLNGAEIAAKVVGTASTNGIDGVTEITRRAIALWGVNFIKG
jgi:hypothetical protein